MSLNKSIDDLTDFMMELDQLKSVERKSTISSGARRENSAEHSWHLAMSVWIFSEFLQKDQYNTEHLIKMALVHDIGEIYAGDTFLFSPERSDAVIKERESLLRTATHPGNPISQLTQLWDEQETGTSRDTTLLKALDRLLPFLLNLKNKGGTWQEFGVTKAQVLQSQTIMASVSPSIHQWILEKVELAVTNGWLNEQ